MVEKKMSGNGLLKTIKNTSPRSKSVAASTKPIKAIKKKSEVNSVKTIKAKKAPAAPKMRAVKSSQIQKKAKASPKVAPTAVKKNPIEVTRELFQKAIALHQQGSIAEAKKLCDQMIALDSRSFDAYHFLGIMAVQERQMDLASKMLTIAAEINPLVPQVHNNLGVIFRSLGQLERALESVTRAIELNPNYAEAYNNQGVLYRDLRKNALALNSFESALKLRPEYEDAKSNYDALLKLQEVK